MNWLLVAVSGQFFAALAALVDKMLLARSLLRPASYAFYLGLLGVFSFFLIPFGVELLSLRAALFAALAGATFVYGFYFFFLALKRGELSETVPALAGISPLAALLGSALMAGTSLSALEGLGFAFLVSGSILLTLTEPKGARFFLTTMLLAAGVLLGFSTVLTKEVFAETDFLSGFVWIKAWGVVAVFGFLLSRQVREEIIGSWRRPEARGLFVGGRVAAMVGSFLLYFAVSLAHPALVEATAGMRYAFIFIAGWLLFRENFRGKILVLKLAAMATIAAGLGWLALNEYIKTLPPLPEERLIVWGVTFSEKFSRELSLDWRKNYLAILDELAPARLRLAAYWDLIEPERGRWDFEALDWQIAEAERRNIPIVLAMGLKLPRWPECHVPDWAEALSPERREEALRSYLAKVILRYRDRRGIMMWQVENEPFLMFGACSARGAEFLDREIALTKSLDPARQILISDGGEFGDWIRAARRGDVFGTTMYRRAYPKIIGPLFGVIEYPIGPDYFRVKERFTRWWNLTPEKRFIVIELQGEPWAPLHLRETPLKEQLDIFSPAYFAATIEYAKRTGFDEFYLWGAEWWWWMKQTHGDDAYWRYAEELLR